MPQANHLISVVDDDPSMSRMLCRAIKAAGLSVDAFGSAEEFPPAITEKQPSFSATQFMKSATQPTVIGDRTVFEYTSLEKPGKASKSIAFVPSRGPKLPWQIM